MKKISKYLTLEEATRSNTARRNGLSNQPGPLELVNIEDTARKLYDPIVDHFGLKPFLHCFFVTQAVNNLRAGAYSKSKHVKGIAFDADYDNVPEAAERGITNSQVFYFVFNNLDFDAIIWEMGNDENPEWLHLQYEEGKNRRLIVLAYRDGNGEVQYEYFKLLPEFQRRKREVYGG